MSCFPSPYTECTSYPNTKCVIYTGPNLNNIDVFTNDRLDIILKKINDVFGTSGLLITLTGDVTGSGTHTITTTVQWDNGLPTYDTYYVPLTRELTINGTTYDLSQDRTWTIITNETLQEVTDNGNTTNNHIILSALNSLQTVGYSDSSSRSVYGGFDGSTITGSFYQSLGLNSGGTGITPEGGAEFVIHSGNGITKFNINNYNGSSFNQLFSIYSNGFVEIFQNAWIKYNQYPNFSTSIGALNIGLLETDNSKPAMVISSATSGGGYYLQFGTDSQGKQLVFQSVDGQQDLYYFNRYSNYNDFTITNNGNMPDIRLVADLLNSTSYLQLGNIGNVILLKADNLTTDRNQYLPDGDGTLVLAVNGNIPDSEGKVTIPVGTGTVTNVTGTSPITVTNNTTTPIISIADGAIANVKLANSTISGISLGSSLANLTIGSELISGGSSTYNGSAAKTLAIQSSSITNNMLAGSIDLTTKVTGVLPLANGGTGSSTKNFVDLTTTQTVAGNKTLTGITTVNTDATSAYGALRGNQYSSGFANSWSWASTSGVLCGVVGTSGYANTSLVLPSVANEIYGGAFGSHSNQGNAPSVGLLVYGKATAASCYGMKVSAVGQSYDVSGASGYGVYVSSVNATYQNNYGIYINSVTNGIANNYGIYQNGGTKNYFVGTIGIGQTSPTAFFHIKAGTASVSSAPLKFTTGVASQTTKEAGAVNYDGSNLTLSDATYAYTLSKTLTASATLNFPSTAASSSSDLTITVTGAADGDIVSIGVPNVSVNANSCFTAWVSATNTVTIRFNNYQTVGAIDPASGTFKVSVIK